MAGQPDGEAAQAPQHGVAVVRRDGPAGVLHQQLDLLGQGRVTHGHRAHEQVRPARGVLGQGLDRDVDAQLQRAQQHPGAPGVVDHGHHAPRAGGLGDGGDVLDLEGQRGRRFQKHQLGVRSGHGHQLLGRGAGMEEAALNPEPLQHRVAEPARGSVGAGAHQHLVAGGQHRHQGGGDRRGAGGEHPRLGRALQLADRRLQRRLHAQAHAAVAWPVEGIQTGGVGQQHGGGALDRRAHHLGGRAGLGLGAVAGVDQTGIEAPFGLGRLDHGQSAGPVAAGPVTTGASARPPHSDQEPS